jgi:DNA-binding MarR family transcriptional regulator
VAPSPKALESSPAPRDSDEASLARLEVALSALVRWSESKHIRSEVARRSGYDIQPGLMRLLEHFDIAGPMRVSSIAECLQIDVSTVSLQLRQLAKDGLVSRVADDRDRRVALIVITVDGRAAVAAVRAVRRELLAEIFTRIRPVEIEQAAAVLIQVQEHMLADMLTKVRPAS